MHIPGGYYHVIGRGLERRYIFKARIDKLDFLARMGDNLERANAHCLAWALMSNHYHFLVQVGEEPLSRLMAPVLGGFASSYNRRIKRCGYVFQNRYQSILVDEDCYLLELIRYIHLNPVVAGMITDVSGLKDYPWTGHAGMTGKHRQTWHSVNAALAYFGAKTRQARPAYVRYMQESEKDPQDTSFSGGGMIRSHGGWESIERLRKEHIACIGDERILGSSEFVTSALRQDSLWTQQPTRLANAGWNIEKLAEWVCHSTGIDQDNLLLKARGGKLSEAKSILCYLGARELGLTIREIADFLSISQPSATAWVRKGEAHCKANAITLESKTR